MDTKFTNEDIRRHLEELGYRNIPEAKLSTFVEDLRRLIKYEERRKHIDRKIENLENVPPKKDAERQNTQRKVKSKSKTVKTREDISSSSENKMSGSQTTLSSAMIDLSRSRSTTTSCGTMEEEREESSLYVDVRIPRTKSASSLPMEVSLLESRSGVIRCRSSQPLYKNRVGRGRNDPVNLHQEYKKIWNKLNIPGETSHSKLRWAVRGWMMGEEPS